MFNSASFTCDLGWPILLPTGDTLYIAKRLTLSSPTPSRGSATPGSGQPAAGGENGFGGISATPGGAVWAVGSFKTSSSSNQTLIERYVP